MLSEPFAAAIMIASLHVGTARGEGGPDSARDAALSAVMSRAVAWRTPGEHGTLERQHFWTQGSNRIEPPTFLEWIPSDPGGRNLWIFAAVCEAHMYPAPPRCNGGVWVAVLAKKGDRTSKGNPSHAIRNARGPHDPCFPGCVQRRRK
jgi:hypothetical protein